MPNLLSLYSILNVLGTILAFGACDRRLVFMTSLNKFRLNTNIIDILYFSLGTFNVSRFDNTDRSQC